MVAQHYSASHTGQVLPVMSKIKACIRCPHTANLGILACVALIVNILICATQPLFLTPAGPVGSPHISKGSVCNLEPEPLFTRGLLTHSLLS